VACAVAPQVRRNNLRVEIESLPAARSGSQWWKSTELTARHYATRLIEKGISYWLTVALIIAICSVSSDYVYGYLGLAELRSSLFQWLLDHGPRPPEPKYVKIVLVGDQEYWEGEPAGRRPIKRTYLRNIVDHLVDDKAYVIALDFDLRTPNPASTDIPKDYEDETFQLVQTIVTYAAKGIKFVLATPIFYDGKTYWQDSDPYQAYGLCKPGNASIPREHQISADLARMIRETRDKTITCGYIYLPDDPLVIPSRIQLGDETELDSFALAVAKAGWSDLDSVRNFARKIRYGNFISEKKLSAPEAPVLFSATAVLGRGKKEDVDLVKSTLAGRSTAVIVGGQWYTLAIGRGELIDQHYSPVGALSGAVMWANYVEAILDSRLYLFFSPEALHALEIAFCVIAATIFALSESALRQIGWLVLLSVVLLVIQWAALHGFAIFFDAYVPLLGLALHAVSDQLWAHWSTKRDSNERQIPELARDTDLAE
jgi:hypothetical protein